MHYLAGAAVQHHAQEEGVGFVISEFAHCKVAQGHIGYACTIGPVWLLM